MKSKVVDLVEVNIRPVDKCTIVFSDKVRWYCTMPYPGHPDGCPNYNRNPSCPPMSRKRDDILSRYDQFHLVVASFDIERYVAIMKGLHPDWTAKQLRNVLYWQSSVKKAMKKAIVTSNVVYSEVLGAGSGFWKSQSMESAGIYVFGMLKKNGIDFDVKARKKIKMVALLCGRKGSTLL